MDCDITSEQLAQLQLHTWHVARNSWPNPMRPVLAMRDSSLPAMLSGCCTLHRTQPVRFVIFRLVNSMRKSIAAAGLGMLLLLLLPGPLAMVTF